MYPKEFRNADEIINILSSRGMIFSQPLVAKKTLNEINYFFLKGYQKLLVLPQDEKKYTLCSTKCVINI